MKSNYLFGVLLSVLFVSCDKKDNDDAPTKTELMTSSSWKYENAGLDTDRNGTIEISADGNVPACLKDNLISFSANGTGTVAESTNVCPGAAASTAITWSFSNNEQNLTLGGGGIAGISGTFKLLALNTTTLSLGRDTTVPLFGTVQLIINLKH
jgi:hypothetical protein